MHIDQIVCGHDGNALDIGKSLLLEDIRYDLRLADQQHFLAVFLRSQRTAPYSGFGRVIAAIASTMILILKLSLQFFDLLERPLGDFGVLLPLALDFIAERLDNAEVYVHRLEFRDRMIGI